MKNKLDRDIEKVYPQKEFIKKLRRLADALEAGRNFTIQIANQRIRVPRNVIINIEHESEKGAEEVEFQIKWKKEK